MNKKIIGLTIILLFSLTISAELNLAIEGIVDNREYFSKYDNHETIFGLREAGTIQFGSEPKHQFTAGVSWFQEFGAPIDEWLAVPLISYQYKTQTTQFTFGSFLRKKALHYSPIFFDVRYDYKRPQVEGFQYQYSFPIGMQSVWVDWDSKISDDRREQFFFGGSGTIGTGKFTVTHHLLYRHKAGGGNSSGIAEDGGVHVIFAYSNTPDSKVDSVQFTAEAIGSYNREQRSDPWNTPIGVEASATVQWSKIGVRTQAYKGVRKSINWHQLEHGAPFYNAPYFVQLDLMLFPHKSEQFSMYFDWGITLVDGMIENRQCFYLTGNFGKTIGSKK